ncbi:MAG: hypothetical protein ABH843_06620 [Candidatus Omnitrophota bacterium]
MHSSQNRNKAIVVLGAAVLVVIVTSVIIYSKKPGANNASGAADQQALPTVVPANTEALSPRKALPIELMVPEGAGHIIEGFKATGDGSKTIIHIQDIHTNYEAQKNLSRIIENLIKDNELKLIMVEGGWGNVSLTYLRSYADKERRVEVAEEYLKEGKISGEEYLNIISDYDMELEGLETEELYKQNLEAFFEIEQFRKKGSEEIEGLRHAVKKLKEKIYSPQMLELENAKQGYEDEKISLADFYRQISAQANKAKQDLSPFPNFNSFIGVTESEKHINFPQVEKERSTLIEKLSKDLPKQKLTALVTRSLEFRLNKLTPAEYHTYLIKEAQDAGESLDSFPNLKKYVNYITSHENIDTTALFEEAEKLTHLIGENLTRDSRQKRLSEISRSLNILDNFLNLKLVPNDFKYYKEHKSDFITANAVDFLEKEIGRQKIKTARVRPAATVDKNLATLVKFYDIANERDDTFVKNAIRLMNEKEESLAVLIAGGFHTPALKQKLRECGMSYVVVAPHTTQQTDPELYRYILKYKSGKEEE